VPDVAALVGLTTVSRAVGDAVTAQRLTLAAAEGAQVVDWAAADGSLRRALPGLVATLGAMDADRAAALPQLCEEFPPTADSTGGERIAHALARAAVAGSRRRLGEQRGACAGGQGRGRTAITTARWNCCSSWPQPANASTRPLRADELTCLVPCSRLRRCYEALERYLGLGRRPPERQVMLAICEGLSTLAIAQRFGRSKNTIRKQTRRGKGRSHALGARRDVRCGEVIARAMMHFG
jgi:DNA-directed RNA polymerase specialized sigma24 family protein